MCFTVCILFLKRKRIKKNFLLQGSALLCVSKKMLYTFFEEEGPGRARPAKYFFDVHAAEKMIYVFRVCGRELLRRAFGGASLAAGLTPRWGAPPSWRGSEGMMEQHIQQTASILYERAAFAGGFVVYAAAACVLPAVVEQEGDRVRAVAAGGGEGFMVA